MISVISSIKVRTVKPLSTGELVTVNVGAQSKWSGTVNTGTLSSVN